MAIATLFNLEIKNLEIKLCSSKLGFSLKDKCVRFYLIHLFLVRALMNFAESYPVNFLPLEGFFHV
jgi:surface polysaccharide O-acyltransferase-like enzyme